MPYRADEQPNEPRIVPSPSRFGYCRCSTKNSSWEQRSDAAQPPSQPSPLRLDSRLSNIKSPPIRRQEKSLFNKYLSARFARQHISFLPHRYNEIGHLRRLKPRCRHSLLNCTEIKCTRINCTEVGRPSRRVMYCTFFSSLQFFLNITRNVLFAEADGCTYIRSCCCHREANDFSLLQYSRWYLQPVGKGPISRQRTLAMVYGAVAMVPIFSLALFDPYRGT